MSILVASKDIYTPQPFLRPTPPKPGCINTQGQTQTMVYPKYHPDPKLQGKPKGMKAAGGVGISVGWVDKEMWIKGTGWELWGLLKISGQKGHRTTSCQSRGYETGGYIGRSEHCPSQWTNCSTYKWLVLYALGPLTERWFCKWEAIVAASPWGLWPCGLVLPKSHCELNPIEILWGYAKYQVLFHCCFGTLLTENPVRLSNSMWWQIYHHENLSAPVFGHVQYAHYLNIFSENMAVHWCICVHFIVFLLLYS